MLGFLGLFGNPLLVFIAIFVYIAAAGEARMRITATSFTNSYEWGDFKGDPANLMECCFDLHLYLATGFAPADSSAEAAGRPSSPRRRGRFAPRSRSRRSFPTSLDQAR